MAKFNYSKLLDSGSLSASFNEEVDRQTAAGRVPHFFLSAVNAKYGFAIPEKKAEFIKFRSAHVAYAGMSKEERAKQDETPACWVKGHILRSDLFGAMDAIASGLTKVDTMSDTADWLTLFAPVKAVKAPAAKPAAASVEPARLGASTATFPALGAAPKSTPATSGDVFTGLSLADALETIEAALKAGTMPGDFALRLDRALKGYYMDTAVKGNGNKKQVKAALDGFFTETVQTAH